MNWKDVGDWIIENAGPGAALIGSMVGGPIPAAVAAGVSLIAAATGHGTPEKALETLKGDPATLVKLQELAAQSEAQNLQHIEAMAKVEEQDAQAEQHETQTTIRAGDTAEDPYIRHTRPNLAYVFAGAALLYVLACVALGTPAQEFVLGAFMSFPLTYAGSRWHQHIASIGAPKQ